MNSILEILNNLELIIQYFLPGFLAIYFFDFLMAKKLVINTQIIILSGCFSLFTISGLKSLTFFADKQSLTIFSSIIILLIATFTLSCAVKSLKVESWTVKNFKISLFDDSMTTTLNSKDGAYVRIFLKGEDCYLQGHFANQDGKYITLSHPEKYEIKTDRLIYSYENINGYAICAFDEIKYLLVVKE